MQDSYFSNGHRQALPPSKSDLDAARRKIMEILGSAPSMLGPAEPATPAYRTEDALKGGLGLLLSSVLGGPEGLASFAQAYTEQKQSLANLKTQTQQQKTDFANQQALQRYNQQLGMAETDLGYKREDYQQAWDEYQRQLLKSEKTQADEAKVLDEARVYARKMGGNPREYVQGFVARGELGMDAAGRVLGKINDEEYGRRFSARSKSFQASDATIKALQARYGLQGLGETLATFAVGKQPSKPVSKQEIYGEIQKLYDLKKQIDGDIDAWRRWNGLAPGERDDKLTTLSNLLQQIETRVKQLFAMAGPPVAAKGK